MTAFGKEFILKSALLSQTGITDEEFHHLVSANPELAPSGKGYVEAVQWRKDIKESPLFLDTKETADYILKNADSGLTKGLTQETLVIQLRGFINRKKRALSFVNCSQKVDKNGEGKGGHGTIKFRAKEALKYWENKQKPRVKKVSKAKAAIVVTPTVPVTAPIVVRRDESKLLGTLTRNHEELVKQIDVLVGFVVRLESKIDKQEAKITEQSILLNTNYRRNEVDKMLLEIDLYHISKDDLSEYEHKLIADLKVLKYTPTMNQLLLLQSILNNVRNNFALKSKTSNATGFVEPFSVVHGGNNGNENV
jgi:hypothetical protein